MEIQALRIEEKNPLFADYLRYSAKVQDFYPSHFKNDWQSVIDQRSGFETPRNALVEILSAQNKSWDAPEKTLENIKRLSSPKALAVVTGQQAGILGGPLYTFFKTMTVLKLSEKLQKEYPDYNFAPLFWMEVNDSDFKEISAIHYISKENELKQLVAEENPGDVLKPVFARGVDEKIRQWRQTLTGDFFDTEFKEEALNAFFGSYDSQENYADAFARLLLKFFGKQGLIVLNPSDPAISRLAKPLFTEALNSPEKILQSFSERSNALQKTGHAPQITLGDNQTLLFFNDTQSRRVRVDFEGGQFLLKYPEGYQSVKRDELLKSCAETPERFSPNVALRPLVQDYILPTVAYVAGPAEVAYFAQVESLYRRFKIPMPVIYPRHRLTIAEGKIQKHAEKLNLDYEEILAQKPGFTEEFLRRLADQSLYRSMESAEKLIAEALESLRKSIIEADPTLENTLEKTRQSVEGSFRQLSAKVQRSLEQKNQTGMQQLEKVLLNLLPDNTYQERVLNMVYFCIKYGVGFVDELFAALPEDTGPNYLAKL